MRVTAQVESHPKAPISHGTGVVDASVPPTGEQIVEVIPQEQIREHTVKEIMDVLVTRLTKDFTESVMLVLVPPMQEQIDEAIKVTSRVGTHRGAD